MVGAATRLRLPRRMGCHVGPDLGRGQPLPAVVEQNRQGLDLVVCLE